MFKVTIAETGTLVLRVCDLAFDMQPKIRVLGADGVTVIGEFDFVPQADEYFFTVLNVAAGDILYAEVSHSNASATTGSYDISIGKSLESGGEPHSYGIYLPLVFKSY